MPYSEQNGGHGTLEIKSGVIGHHPFVHRVQQKTHNIELEVGPAQKYSTKEGGKAGKEFATKLVPLTCTIEELFRGFLLEEYKKYKAVYNIIYNEKGQDQIDETFGVFAFAFVTNSE